MNNKKILNCLRKALNSGRKDIAIKKINKKWNVLYAGSTNENYNPDETWCPVFQRKGEIKK